MTTPALPVTPGPMTPASSGRAVVPTAVGLAAVMAAPIAGCSVNQQSEHRRVPGAALAAAALVSCLAAVYSLR